MPLLLDVSGLCDHHTDEALESFYKAASEPPDDGVCDPHPSPFLRRLVELFTQRGLARSEGMKEELQRWLAGDMHREAHDRPERPAGIMERWSRAELALAKLYLESLPPAEFTLDDWLMVVDYLAQRYLPESDLRTEADWLATRAGLMGRVAAAMGEATEAQADKLLATLPGPVAMTPLQRAVLDFGAARCAENVVGMAGGMRHRLRRLIVDRQEAEYLGDRTKTAESLQTQLVDAFGTWNKDWRRIAVTEAGENLNQGLIASVPDGARVRRVEKYRGACAFCISIDGRVMDVVAPDAPEKDGATQVWTGKTNVGRSSAPRRRLGNTLVDREPHELWWIAAGVQHPHCRGGWVVLEQGKRRVDKKFSDWMDKVLERS